MASVIETAHAADEIVSYNPATGEEVGRVAIMSAEEVQDAVKRAREAFNGR